MELGFSSPVFLPCRLISTANCKNAATPLSPTLHKMEKKGRKKRWIGAESGRYSVNYSRPIFRPFDAARRIDTQRSSMRPNLASWRINWQTRRARSVLSLPLSLLIPWRRRVLNIVSRIGLLRWKRSFPLSRPSLDRETTNRVARFQARPENTWNWSN